MATFQDVDKNDPELVAVLGLLNQIIGLTSEQLDNVNTALSENTDVKFDMTREAMMVAIGDAIEGVIGAQG